MTAGLNMRFTIWRMATVAGDDVVGGAIPTGTAVYTEVRGRMEGRPTSQVFLEQGLETDHLSRILVRPASMDIRERDEIEVTFPPGHFNIDERFRIVGVKRGALHPRDGRGALNLDVSQIVRSRATLWP